MEDSDNIKIGFDLAIEINKFYTCPDNCGVCCRLNQIEFSKQEYFRVLAKLEPENRDAFRASVVKKDVFKDMIERGFSRASAIKAHSEDFRAFKSTICPMQENNKCSIHSLSFRMCKKYPFTFDESEFIHNRALQIVPCAMGLDIIYDIVGYSLINAYSVSGIDALAFTKNSLIVVVGCYKEMLTPDCENPTNVILTKFQLNDAIPSLCGFLAYLTECHNDALLPLLYSRRALIRQMIETCAWMQEIEDVTLINFMEKFKALYS